jgi:hypothetical protein
MTEGRVRSCAALKLVVIASSVVSLAAEADAFDEDC